MIAPLILTLAAFIAVSAFDCLLVRELLASSDRRRRIRLGILVTITTLIALSAGLVLLALAVFGGCLRGCNV